jgi:PAS domain S-box-containing protein
VAQGLPEDEGGLGAERGTEHDDTLSVLRSAIESTADGLLAVDLEGRVKLVNGKFLELWGIPKELSESPDDDRLLSFVLDQLEKPEDFLAKVRELYADPDAESFDVLTFKDGRIFERYSQPQTVGNKSIGRVWSFRDVTQQRQAQEALRASEERLRQITETINEVFWITTPDASQVMFVSKAFEDLWGLSRESVYRTPQLWLDSIHPEDRERVTEVTYGILPTRAVDIEYRLVHPDGTVRWIRDRGFPVRDNDGTVQSLSGVAEDITERKRVEEQLRQSQKMEAVGHLAGGIAHDFNNLLHVIINSARLVKNEMDPNDFRRDDLDAVSQAAGKAQDLVGQLLAFSRKQVIHPEVRNVNGLIREIEGLLERTLGEDITLAFRLSPSVPPARLDPAQFTQVLLNLAVNAREAMPTGGLLSIETIDVIADEKVAQDANVPPGEYVCLVVSDTGVGMSKEVASKVFEPFFTTKSRAEATGLGLSTAYGIVRQSGGQILLDSDPGSGTMFRIYLPAVPSSEAELAPPPPRPSRTLAKGSVLVVEDNDMVLDLTARILTRNGYEVVTAHSPTQAIQLCEDHPGDLDVVLSDVVMPEMSGIELARRLVEVRPGLKIIFMSGYTTDVVSKHGLDVDAVFVQKPFTADKVLATLSDVLQ